MLFIFTHCLFLFHSFPFFPSAMNHFHAYGCSALRSSHTMKNEKKNMAFEKVWWQAYQSGQIRCVFYTDLRYASSIPRPTRAAFSKTHSICTTLNCSISDRQPTYYYLSLSNASINVNSSFFYIVLYSIFHGCRVCLLETKEKEKNEENANKVQVHHFTRSIFPTLKLGKIWFSFCFIFCFFISICDERRTTSDNDNFLFVLFPFLRKIKNKKIITCYSISNSRILPGNALHTQHFKCVKYKIKSTI